jgi:ectoine hydroxylase-related dioxygenase (phytanoyl-CoA dioxygenase family)
MTDTLVADMPARLESQAEQYHRQGYLVVRGLLPAEAIQEAAAEADTLRRRTDLIATDNLRCRWQPHVRTEECLFETFDPVIDIGPVCARLAAHRRILYLLATLYQHEAFLFKDKLIFKPPGAKGYDLHQDYISWPSFPRSFTTVLVPLDPARVENGCTVVYPGYHRHGYLSPADGMYHSLPAEFVASSGSVPLELDPGDVAVFGCFTPHCSAPNLSSGWRRQLYLSYNAAADGGERRAAHYEEFLEWLRARYAEYGKVNVYFR